MIQPIPLGLVHASCVDIDGKAVLIIGSSNSGKSSLALALMSLGGNLVGDDQVDLLDEAGILTARPAPNLSGLIEARGAGILKVPNLPRSYVSLVVDLDRVECERLPEQHSVNIGTHKRDIVFGRDFPNLHFVIYQWMSGNGRI